MNNFDINLFFDDLEMGKSGETSSSLIKRKKEIKQEFDNSKVRALNRKVTALFSTLDSIKGDTIDPRQWFSLPLSVRSMYNIGKQGKFITILN